MRPTLMILALALALAPWAQPAESLTPQNGYSWSQRKPKWNKRLMDRTDDEEWVRTLTSGDDGRLYVLTGDRTIWPYDNPSPKAVNTIWCANPDA